MQLRHAEYFVATADAGSVSAASTRLHVGQPAMSRQLRQLEQDLGVSLFDRGVGKLGLNRTGRALLPAARDLLQAASALQSAARFHALGRVDHLAIAAPTVTLTDLVSPFVASMTFEDPVIEVRAGDGLTTAQMLEQGADLAIGTQRPPRPLAARPLAVLPVWAYVRSDDLWASRASVNLDELVERQLVSLPSTFTAREALDASVAQRGLSFSELVEAANGTIAQALAASGRGVAIVSDDPRFDLRPLAIDTGVGQLLHIRLMTAWDTRGVAAPAVEAVAGRLATWVRHRYPDSAVSSFSEPEDQKQV